MKYSLQAIKMKTVHTVLANNDHPNQRGGDVN